MLEVELFSFVFDRFMFFGIAHAAKQSVLSLWFVGDITSEVLTLYVPFSSSFGQVLFCFHVLALTSWTKDGNFNFFQ